MFRRSGARVEGGAMILSRGMDTESKEIALSPEETTQIGKAEDVRAQDDTDRRQGRLQ